MFNEEDYLDEDGFLDDAIIFHDTLNPAIWEIDGEMKPEVRNALMAMAGEFQDFLGLDNLDVRDIVITGSNAAFTYTPHSDIDLHLVVRIPARFDELYLELFDAKKNLYNLTHDQKIKGFDVEFYVEDEREQAVSMGIFSILKNRWIHTPRKVKASIDDASVKAKVSAFQDQIAACLESNDIDLAKKTWENLKAMRKAGLDSGGEFSPENLAFKILRTQGLNKKLFDHIVFLKDKELSLESRTR